jgi:hypothetical protein
VIIELRFSTVREERGREIAFGRWQIEKRVEGRTSRIVGGGFCSCSIELKVLQSTSGKEGGGGGLQAAGERSSDWREG